MNIHSLSIENFRSLSSLTLPDLGRINLLVGKNNSGKTSVLEALRVLSNGGSIKTLLELAIEREDQIGSDNPEEDGFIKQAISGIFHNRAIDSRAIYIGDASGSLNLALKRVQYIYRREEEADGASNGRRQILTPEQAKLFVKGEFEDVDLREALDVSIAGQQVDLARIDRLVSRLLVGIALEAKTPIAPCGYVAAHPNDVDELAALWDQIALTDREAEVVTALKLIEPSIAGLTFVEASAQMEDVRSRLQRRPRVSAGRIAGRRIPLVKLDGSNERIPLRSMGDGLHRVLDVVLRLVAIQDGFFLIDEFENGLHYSIHDKLWNLVLKIATERSIQVFATTHSDDCVRAFSEVSSKSSESGVLYRIARPALEGDKHFVRMYSEQTLVDAEEAELEVR